MDFLLDTCVVLWWLSQPEKLTKKAQTTIADSDNILWVSAASIWEIAIKYKLKRLDIPHHFLDTVRAEQIQLLPIEVTDAMATIDLPSIHQDHFDRIIIAQAKANNFVLITRDEHIMQYPIATLKA